MKTLKDLPSPKGKFLLGHLSNFNAENKHTVLEEWANETGKVYRINLVGKRFIVSADSHLNLQILKQRPDKFRRFSKITEVMEEMGVLGVFNAEGETWKKHRKLSSEALNLKNTVSYFPVIQEVCGRLLNKWKKLEAKQSIIEVQREMTRFTVDITSTIAFGYPMNTLENEEDAIQQQLGKIFPMINGRISTPFPLWRLIKLKKDRELDKALIYVNETIHRCINEAKKRLATVPGLKENPSNFLEALLIEQEKEGNFTDKEVRGNVFTMLVAGEDTTSNSISWAIYYLAQRPDAVKRIRNEAADIYGNELFPLYNENLSMLKYTEAVVLEAMRLKPVTPTLFMEALEDVEIDGLQIKKGMTVMLQNKVAQTQAENFVRPDEFLPERWLRGSGCPVSGAHNPEVMRVFGGGPRFCPGKTLAMHEMITVLSMICKNFDVQLAVDMKEITEMFAFTMCPRNLWIKLARAG